ncbi:M20/M25/M40 family metallo-hydrolase [Lacrimispora sp. NSJ-141]|uniref:M20/M25/M40 family metallo-hydrolase n=1 Tax=Lientehia hominis TaxID=2897778 RepID=A0AAP2RJB9_9FIRM|nr:M20/M25/M40 family metallo-hydrolase [Lientehia hominis]MCD2492438.1 M20/M25/M40 family metallo-hydrolase [Lientehia hominis]
MPGEKRTVPEIIRLLKALIDCDTTRGKKNERQCALQLQAYFDKMGIENRIYEPEPFRTSIAAVIPGRNPDALVLYSHLDTEDYLDLSCWRFPPGLGVLSEGRVYGRGALDDKGMTAVNAVIMAEAARQDREKTLIFVSACGEEDCEDCGLPWLLNHTRLFSHAGLVLSEGGGFPVCAGGVWYYTVQVGERDGIPAERTGCGQDGAVLSYREGRRSDGENNRRHVAEECLEDAYLPEEYRSLLKPHLDRFRKAELLPVISSGFSDNRHFRRAGIPVLGFFPLDERNSISGIHGYQEYISVDSLELAYQVLYGITEQWLEAPYQRRSGGTEGRTEADGAWLLGPCS